MLLVCLMIVSMLPTSVFAANEVSGSMTGSDFLNKAVDNAITLTGNVTLTSTASKKSGTLTIDLNGHTLKTEDVVGTKSNDYVTSENVFELSGSANLTVTDTGETKGYIQAGSVSNSNRNGGDPKTININTNYTGTFTIDGAMIKGADCYDSNLKSYAIYAYGGKIVMRNNASVVGGVWNSTDSTYTDGKVYTYIKSGTYYALCCNSNVAVDITSSTITGGSSNTGFGTTGLYLGSGCTGTIEKTTITGGSSETYRAGDAVSLGGNISFKGCTITGGSCSVPSTGDGEGGSAVYFVGSANASFEDCNITGGNGVQTYAGCGFEVNTGGTSFATITAKNCTISGGTTLPDGSNENYGAAIWFYGNNNIVNL